MTGTVLTTLVDHLEQYTEDVAYALVTSTILKDSPPETQRQCTNNYLLRTLAKAVSRGIEKGIERGKRANGK